MTGQQPELPGAPAASTSEPPAESCTESPTQSPVDSPADSAADSHGVPWAHRDLSPSGFETDDGSADPALRARLIQVSQQPSTEAEVDLLAALAQARWLVPVVAVAVDTQVQDGRRVEGTAEMASVTLTAPDGRAALPVFSGLDTLAAWDPAARPVPVSADRAAQAAIAEGCDTMLVDLGAEHALALRPSMVWALAMRRPWAPAHQDPGVAAALGGVLAEEAAVAAYELADGPPHASGVLRVTLRLHPGLDDAGVQALVTRVGERLATDGEIRARIDGLRFSIAPAAPTSPRNR